MSIAKKQFCLSTEYSVCFIVFTSFRKTCLINYFLKLIWLLTITSQPSDSLPLRRAFKASSSKQSLLETKPSLHAMLS